MSPQLCITVYFSSSVFAYSAVREPLNLHLDFHLSSLNFTGVILFLLTLRGLEKKLRIAVKATGDINYQRWATHKQKEKGSHGGGKQTNKLSHRSVSSAFPTSLFLACMSFSSLYSICFTKLSSTEKSNLSSFFIWIQTQKK